MDDLISRQAAKDAVRRLQTYKLHEDDDMILVDKADVQTELMLLPPAKQQYEPVTAEDFAKTMSESTLYGFMVWHGEALGLMVKQGFVICKKDDVIYRQAAIDALDKRFDSIPMEQTAEILQLRKDLRELPSAQQEKVCIAKITLLEEQVREAVEKAKSEIVQVFSSAQPERDAVEAIPVAWVEEYIKKLQESFVSLTGWPAIETMVKKWKEEQK